MVVMEPNSDTKLEPEQEFEYAVRKLQRLYGVKVTTKTDTWPRLWRAIDVIFKILTFGKVPNTSKRFTTTLGNIVFFPAGWERYGTPHPQDVSTVRHEGKHIQQYERLGGGNVWLGTVIMLFLYLFVPLPLGLSWFRYVFEREAYCESLKSNRELGLVSRIDEYTEALTGPAYLWAWPFKKRVKDYFIAISDF